MGNDTIPIIIQLVTLISVIVGLILLIRKSGADSQRLVSDISEVKNDVLENKQLAKEDRARVEEVMRLITTHVADTEKHIDVRRDSIIAGERTEQLRRIERGLEDLKRETRVK